MVTKESGPPKCTCESNLTFSHMPCVQWNFFLESEAASTTQIGMLIITHRGVYLL